MEQPAIAMSDVVRFMRQLSHDIRNSLNAAELQAAYIAEIATDAEVSDELKRLREIIGELGTMLQKLTFALGDLKLAAIPYGARDFVEDAQQAIEREFPGAKGATKWNVKVAAGATVEIDPQLLQRAFVELFDNAIRHRPGDAPINVSAKIAGGEFVFTLAEPKASQLGEPPPLIALPFQKMSHGHYGLGLYRVRRIIGEHGGRFEQRYDSATAQLLSEVRLPLAANGA